MAFDSKFYKNTVTKQGFDSKAYGSNHYFLIESTVTAIFMFSTVKHKKFDRKRCCK